jgi:hypothetical protein
MEIKYEALLGDQDKFKDQLNKFVEVRLWHDLLGQNFVTLDELSELSARGKIPDGTVIVAMRRIIAEPKRWTVEDQEAGRLPEVGAEFKARGYVWECVRILNNTILAVVGDSYCGFDIDECKPIEAPEEKAARLREEWCAKAAKTLKNLEYTSTLTSIYDALLSGELPVPVKE